MPRSSRLKMKKWLPRKRSRTSFRPGSMTTRMLTLMNRMQRRESLRPSTTPIRGPDPLIAPTRVSKVVTRDSARKNDLD